MKKQLEFSKKNILTQNCKADLVIYCLTDAYPLWFRPANIVTSFCLFVQLLDDLIQRRTYNMLIAHCSLFMYVLMKRTLESSA